MVINSSRKLGLLSRIFHNIFRLPIKYALLFCLQPLEAVRYTEFSFFLEFLKRNSCSNMNILDVSSPFLMAYLLTATGTVIKTDINSLESVFIKETPRLRFQKEDATQLSFADETFDLTYSISVIEHIFGGYAKAIQEMLRVTRHGGIVYLTFPVSSSHIEEWLDSPIYSDQYSLSGRTFFQYRFDETDVQHMASIFQKSNAKIISQAIYWERKDGLFNKAVNQMRKNSGSKIMGFLRGSFLHYYYGFTLLEQYPRNFRNARSFGNMQIILEKI